MTASPPTDSTTGSRAAAVRVALIQAAVVIGLCLIVFSTEFDQLYTLSTRNPEAAHLLAFPVLAALLLYRRWDRFTGRIARGSIWGMVILLAGLALYFVSSWPFNYGYPRLIAMVIALTGALLMTCGRRALSTLAPILLLLLVALPIGPRIYARLIISPETQTLEAAAALLNALPGVTAEVEHLDLFYTRGGAAGSIALGEPHRGFSLLLAYLTIGLFVTFIRVRPAWQAAVMLIVLAPAAVLLNLIRVLIFGLVTIYSNAGPLSAVPRYVSMLASLLLAYGAFAVLVGVLGKMIVEEPAGHDAPDEQAQQED